MTTVDSSAATPSAAITPSSQIVLDSRGVLARMRSPTPTYATG
jgi:hypothetical protein